MRSIAVSMIAALAVAVLALCGGGRALATTTGGSVASASGLLPGDAQDIGPAAPVVACENALGALGIAAASCDAGLSVLSGLPSSGTRAGGSSASQPDCQCGSMPTPSATPSCQCMSTPPPTPMCSCTSAASTTGKGNAPPIGDTPPMGDTPQVGAVPQKGDSPPIADTLQKGESPPRLRDSADVVPADSTGSPILPITGANMEPLAAAASIFLIAGTAALVAGRRRHVVRVAGAHGKRRHAHGSRRAAR
jgi:hypothetical protein